MKSLSKSALLVFLMMILSKGLGFIREICLAYQFGTSYIVDAFTLCVSIPGVLFTIYASGFSQSYIPTYSRLQTDEEKRYFFNNVMSILVVVSIIAMLLCLIFNEQIINLMAPGFDYKTQKLSFQFIRIIVFVLPTMTIFNILVAQVSTKENFVFSNFCGFIVVNVIIIIAIMLSNENVVMILPIGYLFASFFSTFLMSIYAEKKERIRYSFKFDLKNNQFIQLTKLAIPLGISLLVNQLNAVIDSIFASMLGEGIISGLNYANKIQSLFLTLTTTVFLSICYPRINHHFAKLEKEKALYYLKKGLMIAIYTSIPLITILFCFATPVVKLLFERGVFDSNSTFVTASCLAFYAIGIPFYAFREVCTNALAANQKQKLIMKNTIIAVVFNTLSDLLLIRPLGYIGLALSTSMAGLLTFVLAIRDLKKLGLTLFDQTLIPDIFKIFISTFLSVMGCWLINSVTIVGISSNLIFLIAIFVACCVFLLCSFIFKIEIFEWVYVKFSRKK